MEIGTVEQVDIVGKMRESYLDYAMSVITARALPDVRDGLKPVQRRILYAMDDMGLRHDRPYKKSARIVGEVLGKYHPHGDEPVYETMVRMAQDFSMRYPLVDGQGNFGSVDGDNAAAMRYTEARLAAIAEEMLVDIDKDTVDFVDNFDGSLKEPAVLPSRVPNMLLNGAAGIAVGMATNIPPHNLSELADAIIYLIDHYDNLDDITVEDLLRFVPGPDFPTGGIILGKEGIRQAYATGKGKLVVRSKVHTEDVKGGRSRIIVTELPYQVNKANLIERIAELVRNHRIETISDLRDESDRHGMRIVIELKRGEDPRPTIEQLFKDTPMQGTFGVNILALVDMTPRLLPLKRALHLFIEHRHQVITRRSRFELDRARARAHVLEGLKIALDHLDEVISTIRRSQTAETAMQNLMRKFRLSEIQARAILDMQLRRLAALERKKIEDEYADVIQQIAYLEDLLANPRKILYLIKEDMQDIKRTYGDARRTHIVDTETGELQEGDLIPDADVFVGLTERGYITRIPFAECKVTRLTNMGLAVGARDAVTLLVPAKTRDTILFFTDRGNVFQDQVHRILGVDRQEKGQQLSSMVGLAEKERVTAFLTTADLAAERYLTIVTRNGRIKRTEASEFSQIPAGGLTAIALDEGDQVVSARLTRGEEELLLITRQGQAIRFREEEVRPMGRNAAGVWAIKLATGDSIAAMVVARGEEQLLVVTEHGYAKRSLLTDYPLQGRYGNGVRASDPGKLGDTGPIVDAELLNSYDEIVLTSANGNILCVKAEDTALLDRATWSTLIREKRRVMPLAEDDTITCVAVLPGQKPQPVPIPEPASVRRVSKAAAGKTTQAHGARVPSAAARAESTPKPARRQTTQSKASATAPAKSATKTARTETAKGATKKEPERRASRPPAASTAAESATRKTSTAKAATATPPGAKSPGEKTTARRATSEATLTPDKAVTRSTARSGSRASTGSKESQPPAAGSGGKTTPTGQRRASTTKDAIALAPEAKPTAGTRRSRASAADESEKRPASGATRHRTTRRDE